MMSLRSIAVWAGSMLGVALAQQPAPSPLKSLTRVILNPASIKAIPDTDYSLWTVPKAHSANITLNGFDFTLTAGGTSDLQGSYYKYVYARFLSSLGERVVAEGITTSDQAGLPITLTVKGLSPGNHTFSTWHNAWDKLTTVSPIDVTVDGKKVLESAQQSIRVDNIWETATTVLRLNITSPDQTVEIVYKPSAGNDTRAYLNGFEIDAPEMGNLASFPEPAHRNERVNMEGGTSVTASWRAPKLPKAPKYNVYLGTKPDDLKSVALNITETQVTFSDLDTFETYYWRVDVVTGCHLYIGHNFIFRLAQLAFPGAEGWGRFARGGRGGKILHVTTLEDNEEPGSLRHALVIEKGPRTVVFDVGGIITTTSRMPVNDQYLTVAAQTAPGKGIIIQGYPVGLTGATDVIMRHVRVRPGKISGVTIDGMGMQGSNHCIFDRCSISWAMDEQFSSRSAYNITLQRTLISEPLNVAGHKNYPPGFQHGYAATICGEVGSYHHNLIAHAEGRSWSMGGNVDNAGVFWGKLDMTNNVVYNFGYRTTEGGMHEANFVNNYYKQGPASWITHDLQAQYENDLPGTQQYYCSGNVMHDKDGKIIFDANSRQYPPGNGTSDGTFIACYANVTIDHDLPYQKFFDVPFFPSYVETQSANEAYKITMSDRGAQVPVFDDHDKRIINETLTGTYTYVGSNSGKLGIIDDPADVGGLENWPTVVRDMASWDVDGDGIADWWDGSTGGKGWTPLEGYLNWMADPHAFVEPGSSVEIDLGELARGFVGSVVFEVSGVEKGTLVVKGDKATYTAAGGSAIERLTVALSDAEGSAWSRPFGVAVFAGASKAQ